MGVGQGEHGLAGAELGEAAVAGDGDLEGVGALEEGVGAIGGEHGPRLDDDGGGVLRDASARAPVADHEGAGVYEGVAPVGVLGGEGEGARAGFGEAVGRAAGAARHHAAYLGVDGGGAVLDLDDAEVAGEGDGLTPVEGGVGGVMPEDERAARADEVGGDPVDG